MSFIEELKDKLQFVELSGYRVFVIGGRGVCIEGHKGIYEISDSAIRVKVKNGSIRVIGQDLIINDISDSEIFIQGSIKGLEL